MMMIRWTGSMSLLFALLAALVLIQATDIQTALAQEAAAEKTEAVPPGTKSRAPHTCTIIPIAVYGSDTLYEANYHETDDCEAYTITYVFGTFQYPRICTDCGPQKRDQSRRFFGLAMPVPADYRHMLPAGKPYKYSKEAPTPNGIDYLYLERKGVYVKVFSFLVNRKDMKSGVEPDDANFANTLHVAFECSNPATIGVDLTQIDEVHERKQKPMPDPGGAPTTVYDVTYEYAGGSAHILTFLCGDPEPPEPTEGEEGEEDQ